MGRKGVSKRKPVQTKSKPLSGGAASGTVTSVMAENQPSRPFESGKTASSRGGDKPSAGQKKNARKS